jgi:hypothetical protein
VDWVSDAHELTQAVPSVLRSVCQTPEADRLAVIRFVEDEIAHTGGAASARFTRNGGDLGDVRDTLTLERTRDLVRAAIARDDECPFGLAPDEAFAGVHGDARRVVIFAESSGGFGLVIRRGDVALGGGGGGRVLVGWGVDDRLTLAIGPELGGAASFPTNEEGTTDLAAQVTGAVPIVARLADSLRVYELEVAMTARFRDGTVSPPGVRASFGFGLSALRTRAFMPLGILWIGWEAQPIDGVVQHSVRIGTHVGLDWDP